MADPGSTGASIDLWELSPGRWELDLVLGSYPTPPTSIADRGDEAGEPPLRSRAWYNVSRRPDGSSVVAVNRAGFVGVDTEPLTRDVDGELLARWYYTEEERAKLRARSGPDPDRYELLRHWCRKEAYVKLLGAGGRRPMKSFSVLPSAGSWTVDDLELASGNTATIVDIDHPTAAIAVATETPRAIRRRTLEELITPSTAPSSPPAERSGPMVGPSERICIVGAGVSGLAMARHLKAHDFDFVVYDAGTDVGGMWNIDAAGSPAYESLHLNTSKQMTAFPDLRMPRYYPTFPGHRLAAEYLRSYADHHGLYRHIEFGRRVSSVERPLDSAARWAVTTDDGTTTEFDSVVIAAGNNRRRRWPVIPGNFSGEVIHSRDYRDGSTLAGRRVVVVGAGNSGCDIVCDAAEVAEQAFLSQRRGYLIWPKHIKGLPIDWINTFAVRTRQPIGLRRAIGGLMHRALVGTNAGLGLPDPDHRIYESHLILNQDLPRLLRSGQVLPKADIVAYDGPRVRFADGSSEEVDVVVLATGYRVEFPFIDDRHLNVVGAGGTTGGRGENHPLLYLGLFHPSYDDLFVVGMLKPDSGVWPVNYHQAEAVAEFLIARRSGGEAYEWFQAQRRPPFPELSRSDYIDTPRHALDVEHGTYLRQLRRLTRGLQQRSDRGRGGRRWPTTDDQGRISTGGGATARVAETVPAP